MIDSIIFDLDGTLWDSTEEVAIAFNKVLKEKYPNVTDEVTVAKLQSLFGRPLYEIAEKLFVSVSKKGHIRLLMIVVIMRRNIWRNMEQKLMMD